MSDAERTQLYLVTPPAVDLATFPGLLGRALDAVPVACLRLALSDEDETQIARAADALREIAHARDVPLVIESHTGLVGRLGLDGVHLRDGSRSVRKVRKALGGDAIVGTHCGASRHDGMTAGEAGADYVAFGPVRQTGLGTGEVADRDLFAWWSEMIEVPVVAEGALDAQSARDLAPLTDFVALGAEIWSSDDPVDAIRMFHGALG